MPLSSQQKGAIGESEASKILMLTTDGELEVDAPAADDDQRDREVHERGHFGISLALQVKIRMRLAKRGRSNEANILHIRFTIDADRLVDHPLFWYLLAELDPEIQTFAEPMFLIDSKTFHERCWKQKVGNKIRLQFDGVMAPTQRRSMWAPFKCTRQELGPRALRILRDYEKSASGIWLPKHLTVQPGVVRVGVRRARQERRAA